MRFATTPPSRIAGALLLAGWFLLSASCRPQPGPPVDEVAIGDLLLRYFTVESNAGPGEYLFSATIENQGAALPEGFEIEVTSIDPGTVVVEGYVGVPPVGAGETVDGETFFRVSQPPGPTFDPTALAFAVSVRDLPFTLVDGAGYAWQMRSRGEARNLTDASLLRAPELRVGGTPAAAETQARTQLAGRQLVHGPRGVTGLTITRKVFVLPSQGLARWLEVVENPGEVQRSATVSTTLVEGLAVPPSAVTRSSSGDAALGSDDDWVVWDDGAGGRPARVHAFSGGAAEHEPARTSDTAVFPGQQSRLGVEFDVLIPAGGKVALLHFVSQQPDEAAALAATAQLAPLDPLLLVGLRLDEVRAVVNWGVLPDADADGLSDEQEMELGSDPDDPDTDGDGVPDGWELDRGLDPLVADGGSDVDGDGLDLLGEFAAGTDPTHPDTDGDLVPDGDEVLVHGTDPFVADTDGDTLLDHVEIAVGTDPLDPDGDLDGDGLTDVEEITTHGTDPGDADSDDDTISDDVEVATTGLDPLDPSDATADLDGDGLDALAELALGTVITLWDSDADGLGDGAELTLGTDPLLADSDGGGRSDGEELLVDETDPGDVGDDLPETPLPTSLVDGDGFLWSLDGSARIVGALDDALPSALWSSVDACWFSSFAEASSAHGGRVLRVGPRRCADEVTHSREVYVPSDGGFARYLEVFHNGGTQPASFTARVRSYLPRPTSALGTSSGDLLLQPEDDWVATTPGEAGVGGPVAFVFSGPRAAIEPGFARRDDYPNYPAMPHTTSPDDPVVTIEWPVTVPPGGRVSILHFAVQGSDAADALDTAAGLRGLPEPALRHLTASQLASIANFDARPDADQDGLPDEDEAAAGTDPADPDTDGDGLLDGFEFRWGLDPLLGGDAGLDPDGDGLDNGTEQGLESIPTAADGDGDGLEDGDEVSLHGTSPIVADTDTDDLDDGTEVAQGFDPLDAFGDADSDGWNDSGEVLDAGTDPFDPDSDDDGMEDGYELAYWALDPLDPSDPGEDPDGDGLDNLTEAGLGTSPLSRDSDDDGFFDDEELLLGTDPALADGDGGGRTDYEELVYDLTDPLVGGDDIPFVELPYTLVDGGGWVWDVDRLGAIVDGTNDVFDDSQRVTDYNTIYLGETPTAGLEDGGRELSLPEQPKRRFFQDERTVRRKIFVPDDASFVRYLDIVENRADTTDVFDLGVFLRTEGNFPLGATSLDDGDLDTLDHWVASAGGLPSLAFVFSNPGASLPLDEAYAWTRGATARWHVTLPPGGRVILMTFVVQAADPASAEAAAMALQSLGGAALEGMSPEELADVANMDVTP